MASPSAMSTNVVHCNAPIIYNHESPHHPHFRKLIEGGGWWWLEMTGDFTFEMPSQGLVSAEILIKHKPAGICSVICTEQVTNGILPIAYPFS